MDAQRTYPQSRQSVNTGDRRFSLIFNRREFAEVMYWIKSQWSPAARWRNFSKNGRDETFLNRLHGG